MVNEFMPAAVTSLRQMRDFGPEYLETDLSRFPVEPWSTFTNLIFLLVIIYWSNRTKLDYRRHPLIVVALPILGVGFIAGTVYHATRSHPLWLYLDFMPILILILLAAVYFWKLTLKSWVLTFLLTLGPVFIYRFFTIFFPFGDKIYISIGYTVLALTVSAPLICHCLIRNRRSWKWLAAAGLCFAVAVACRQLDTLLCGHSQSGAAAVRLMKMMPMGTHFLWHIFGGCSTFFLIQYIYEAEERLNENPLR